MGLEHIIVKIHVVSRVIKHVHCINDKLVKLYYLLKPYINIIMSSKLQGNT